MCAARLISPTRLEFLLGLASCSVPGHILAPKIIAEPLSFVGSMGLVQEPYSGGEIPGTVTW